VDNIQPPWSENALAYAWHQLARGAGVRVSETTRNGFEAINLPVFYAHPDQVESQGRVLIVVPAAGSSWQALLDSQPESLDWLPPDAVTPGGESLPFSGPVPVLFWGAGYPESPPRFAEIRPDGSLVFYCDILAATFFMLSRWEETILPCWDEHQRFLHSASVACRQNFIDRPIVDEYGLILQAWLKILLPGWQPDLSRFTVRLSHDIDVIRRYPKINMGLRAIAGDLIKRHDLGQAMKTTTGLLTQILAPEKDPHLQAVFTLAELSKRLGLESAFYFMAANYSPYDSGYDPRSALVQQCIHYLQSQGFETGFHPGYYTLNNPSKLVAEKSRMDIALGNSSYGGRQHYLRFKVPDTWRQWQEAGLVYDSTMAYPGMEGFRCGTCRPFHPFDPQQGVEMQLWERPLIVMDGTLIHYRNLAPQDGQARILEIARRCRDVRGMFTLLWHNSTLVYEDPQWTSVYQAVVAELARMASQPET
jgi:hypothetical protein